MHKWCAAKVPPAGRSFTSVCNCSSLCLFSYVFIFPRGARMYVRAYNSPPPPQLRGPTLRGLQWHTLALFFHVRIHVHGGRRRRRRRVLKVNCFLKVSPPRPSHIEIWTSFGARYCEQTHGPLFLSTCNYSRPAIVRKCLFESLIAGVKSTPFPSPPPFPFVSLRCRSGDK